MNSETARRSRSRSPPRDEDDTTDMWIALLLDDYDPEDPWRKMVEASQPYKPPVLTEEEKQESKRQGELVRKRIEVKEHEVAHFDRLDQLRSMNELRRSQARRAGLDDEIVWWAHPWDEIQQIRQLVKKAIETPLADHNDKNKKECRNKFYIGGAVDPVRRWIGDPEPKGNRKDPMLGHRTERGGIMFVVGVQHGSKAAICETDLINDFKSRYGHRCENKATDSRGLSRNSINFLYVIVYV